MTATPNEQVRTLTARLRSRGQKYHTSARLDFVLMVATLFVTIAIFIGGDRLSERIFSTKEERLADAKLVEAEAKIYSAVATLAEPVTEVITEAPTYLKPALQRFLADALGIDSSEVSTTKDPIANTALKSDESAELEFEPTEQNLKLEESTQTQNLSENLLREFEVDRSQQTSPEILEELYATTGILQKNYGEISQIFEENLSLLQQLSDERKIYLSDILSRSREYDIAWIKADAEIEVAELQVGRDIDISADETDRLETYQETISVALIRIGSVVLAIWLVKIIIQKRKDSIRLSAFYFAVSDALDLYSIDETQNIIELINALVPQGLSDSLPPLTEMASLSSIIETLSARRS